MDYKKHYNALIERAKTRTLDCYTERHHIIPRCMGGSDEESNLVDLTPEEHYVAHQLLCKIHPEEQKLAVAASMMVVARASNKIYGWLKRRHSEYMRDNNPNKDGSCNRKRKGKYNMSEQAKKNMSDSMKGKVNLGTNNGMFGIKPWKHPKSTEQSKDMWRNADKYYNWWISSGLDFGQNAMAREFGETFKMTHSNLVKYFRNGWIPEEDQDWKDFVENTKNIKERK
jgi:hypothetical protein